MTDRKQRISVALNLQEIMSVIESLPQGHPLLPMLHMKSNVLLSVYKMRRREEVK